MIWGIIALAAVGVFCGVCALLARGYAKDAYAYLTEVRKIRSSIVTSQYGRKTIYNKETPPNERGV